MDPFGRSWYRLRFENEFLKSTGESFQDLFADLMSRRFPMTFIRTRPWGNTGDRKNDGYRQDARILYQVYAPNELEAVKAVAKIEEDFADCLPHWSTHFDTWFFVHNARNGLGPQVLQCLLNLDQNNPNIAVRHMGFEALESEVMQLSERDLEALFGSAPTSSQLNAIRSDDLLRVLNHLAQADATPDVPIKPVSPTKLAKNSFSADSIAYLQFGRRKSDLVSSVVDAMPDPETGERIAQTFRDHYEALKLQNLNSDAVLGHIMEFASSTGVHAALSVDFQRYQAAVAAVIAYLFERCDIFEDPEDGAQ